VRLADWLRDVRTIKSDLEDPHWPCDVLELLFTYVLEGDIKLVPNLAVSVIRDAYATGLRQSLQARRHIHAVAEDVPPIEDDVANIDADPELDAFLIWHLSITLGHPALDIKSAAHCVYYAAKLGQQPVPGVLDDPTTVFRNLRIDKNAKMGLKLDMRALFVHTGKAAVASHIGCQYGSKPAFDAVLPRRGHRADLQPRYTPIAGLAWTGPHDTANRIVGVLMGTSEKRDR
jgi:hypothetical protein